MDIVAVLCALFGKRYKRAFHIDAVKTCFSTMHAFFFISSGRLADLMKHLFRKRHRRRYNIGYPCRCFVSRHRVDSLSCPVTEIESHTAVKMNIRQARYGITSRRIDFLRIMHLFSAVYEPVSIYIDIFIEKNTIFRIDTGVFNNHEICAPFR